MNILYSADYGMGIGDFLVKIYAICHLHNFIKNKYKSSICTFIIEEYFSNLLLSVLNIDFFNYYFDNRFLIQNRSGEYASGLGTNTVTFKNNTLYRRYSAINDFKNNNKGYWEIYSDSNLEVPFYLFDYRDPSTRKSEPIPDYNLKIFTDKFYIISETFIKDNLFYNFDCIYYRSLDSLNYDHLNHFILKLKNYFLNNNKPIFVTSNSEVVKSYICKELNNCVTYKDIDINKKDGYGTASSDSSRLEDLIIEMIIMSYSNTIHYGGNHSYISLFNYYAHLVKKVPLINYH